MLTKQYASDAPIVAFLRRNQMNLFGGFCVAGDLLIGIRGGFDSNLMAGLSGGAMTVGALASAVGAKGAGPVSAPAFTAGGLLSLAAGMEAIHTSGLNPGSLTQTGLGILWTAAPLALFLGDRIASDVRSLATPAAKFLNKILPVATDFTNSSPMVRLGQNLSSAKSNQVGAALYNTACAVIGAGGVEAFVEGIKHADWHKIDDAVMGLGICCLFVAGNTIAGLKPAGEEQTITSPKRPQVAAKPALQ